MSPYDPQNPFVFDGPPPPQPGRGAPPRRRLSVRARLWCLGVLGVVFSIGAAGSGVWAAEVGQASVVEVHHAGGARGLQADADMMHDALRADVYGALLDVERAEPDSSRADVAEHGTNFSLWMRQLEESASDDAVRTAARDLSPKIDAYRAAAAELVGLAGTDRAAAVAALPAFDAAYVELETEMASLAADVDTWSRRSEEDSITRLATVERATIAIAALCALAVAILGSTIVRSVLRPLGTTMNSLDALARRDCRVRAHVDSDDELGQMTTTLNATLAELGSSIGGIAQSAGALNQSARGLAQISSDLTESANESVSRASRAPSRPPRSTSTSTASPPPSSR